MSLAQLQTELLRLSDEDRRQFARWFYAHEVELLGPVSDDEEESDELKAELMRRLQDMEDHPDMWETFSAERFDQMVREFANRRELVRRRRELESGNVKTYSREEVLERMQEAVNEVRRSRV